MTSCEINKQIAAIAIGGKGMGNDDGSRSLGDPLFEELFREEKGLPRGL